MAKTVALLGSVNVGGNRVVMAELRSAMEEMGLAGVRTVVGSGNVIFDTPSSDDPALAERIAEKVEERFGFRPSVALLTKDELAAAIADNPFAESGEAKQVHTVFLSGPLDKAPFDAFARDYDGPEKLAAGRNCFHVDFAGGVARSTLGRDLARAKLFHETGTARNLRSMQRIWEAMA